MEKASISVYFVKSALEPVLARGWAVDELLRQAGISPALIELPQARVSARQFGALWLGVARVLDDELFGQDARRMKVGSFAMLCRTLIQCENLRSALLCMVRFFNLILDDFHCSLREADGQASLVIEETAAPAPRVLGHETLLMMQHGLACWLVGRRIPILAASFSYPEPSRSAEYRRMYCDQLSFSQQATALVFGGACLALPVVQSQRSAKEFIAAAPANIVLKYKNSSGLAAQVRRQLRAAGAAEWPDFDDLAIRMNLSPSTLRRRLLDEGESFQSIKDQLRRDLAIHFLSHSRKSVADVAADLGFAEVSAFHRAFKKWTGTRPGSYRELSRFNQQGEQGQ
jgi:AraC-like DNA-binding protein